MMDTIHKHKLLVCTLVVVLMLPVTGRALAGDGADYDLLWGTVDGGGALVEAGVYRLGGTVGQADAATWSGGDYTLRGGFWGGMRVSRLSYLPLVLRAA